MISRRPTKFNAEAEFRTMVGISAFFGIPLTDVIKLKIPTYVKLKEEYVREYKRRKGGYNPGKLR